MEISAEINEIFGQEMAKLFAAQVSDTELENTARACWREITQDNRYYNESSDLNKAIRQIYLKRIEEAANKILDSEEGQKDTEAQAREIVEHGGFDLRSYIQAVIDETIYRR